MVQATADTADNLNGASNGRISPTDRLPAVDPSEMAAGRFLGFSGRTVLGIVLIPPHPPDPYDRSGGMLIRPPVTGDANVIVQGTNSLPAGRVTTPPFFRQLIDRLECGIDAILALVFPPRL